MVDKNQGSLQDAISHSLQKNEPVRNLWVKLKFPKEKGGLQKKDQIMKNTIRVCQVCDKVFSSGKALGGHMRIHFQQAKYKDILISKKNLVKLKKQNPREQVFSSEELLKSNIGFDHMKMDHKLVCAICGRYFPSMKSLCGHLRCHPDRGWRGLQPPQSHSSSFSSSSSLSDAELSSDMEGQMEIDLDYEGEKEIVNLAESLSGGWVVTARRGRKGASVGSTSEASSSEEDELLHNAARDLMMLSRHLFTCNVKKAGECEALKKRKIDEKVEKNVVSYEEDLESSDLKMVMKNKKKIRKKVIKLCDLDKMDENGATPLNHKVGAAAGDKYRCNTCDKSFPTYQALGGHMSSHNKVVKVVLQNSMDVKLRAQVEEMDEREKEGVYLSTDGPLSQVVSPSDASETCRRGLDFDLNEKLPSEDEVGFGFEIDKTW